MTTDAASLTPASTDLEMLHAAIGGLIGKKCWKVASTYGFNVSMHFGKRLAHDHPRLQGKKKGEWILSTLATAWRLFTPHGMVSSRHDESEALAALAKAVEDRKVTSISVSVPDAVLTVAFGDQYLFQLVPTAKNARSTLPYWELFIPNHKLIVFGPGSSWLCRRSDVPVDPGVAALQESANRSKATRPARLRGRTL